MNSTFNLEVMLFNQLLLLYTVRGVPNGKLSYEAGRIKKIISSQ